jgi:VWFA-related protein
MTRHTVVVLSALLLAGSIGGSAAPGAPDQKKRGPEFTGATTAILVDVVVRDRKGHPVTDLDASDFAVFEDGVRQKVDTFTRVTRGGGIGLDVKWKQPGSTVAIMPGESLPPPSPSDSPTDQATTALVFDHLSEEALGLAQKATLEYVPMSGDSDVRVGVFASDPGMRVMLGYTTDRSAIRHAVSELMPAGTPAGQQKAERRDQVMDRRSDLLGERDARAAAAVTGSGGAALAANGAVMGQTEAELQMLEMERVMIDGFDALDRDHRGYDTTQSLMKVIRTLADTPGRKSIVFFSEGLPVSPVLSARFDDLIDAANRSNVTVYAVDANGLRTRSNFADTRKQLQEFTDDRMRQVMSGSSGSSQPIMRAFERVEDMVRTDSRTGLAKLADETGGFLVEESNNLTSAFKRIDEDNQFHYTISYTPANLDFDGKFRSIDVKAARPGVQVFARKGYRAIRRPPGLQTADYEVPALAMLDRAPLPNAFPITAQGFSFPDPAHPGDTPIVVRLATDSLHYDVDAAKGTYAAQVAVVARVRDAAGHTVHTLSQQYVLSGDAKEIDAARKGTIIFYREPQLVPGVYTLECIAFDSLAGRGSARISTLTVPRAAPSSLGMSSLVLIDHVERTERGTSAGSAAPFYVGNSLVYPNVGGTIRKDATSDLPFYFTVYRGAGGPVAASAQLLKNGRVLADAPIPIKAPETDRIQQLSDLPISSLPAGTYELRITVTSGPQAVSRSTFFTLQD